MFTAVATLVLTGAGLARAVPACQTAQPPLHTGPTSVFGWGSNWHGQLTGAAELATEPYALLPDSDAPLRASAVRGGYMHIGIVDRDGRAWFAGLAEAGQLGGGTSTPLARQADLLPIPFVVDDTIPVQLAPSRLVVDIAGGFQFSCAIIGGEAAISTGADRRVYCTGQNDDGQLGRAGLEGNVSYFVQVTNSTAEFGTAILEELAAGPNHMLARDAAGGLWAWGSNSHGQLGVGAGAPNSTSPRRVPLTGVAKVSCGFHFCVALTVGSDLYGWGSNNAGQLGNSSALRQWTPVRLAENVSDVSAGGAHVLAVVGGALWSWGSGTMGATGHPSPRPPGVLGEWTVGTPTAVSAFSGVAIHSIAAGAKHSIVLDTCGHVYTFGSDLFGQLGLGQLTSPAQQSRHFEPQAVESVATRNLVPVGVGATWFNSFLIAEKADL